MIMLYKVNRLQKSLFQDTGIDIVKYVNDFLDVIFINYSHELLGVTKFLVACTRLYNFFVCPSIHLSICWSDGWSVHPPTFAFFINVIP